MAEPLITVHPRDPFEPRPAADWCEQTAANRRPFPRIPEVGYSVTAPNQLMVLNEISEGYCTIISNNGDEHGAFDLLAAGIRIGIERERNRLRAHENEGPAEQLQALTSTIAKAKLAANECHRVLYDEQQGPSATMDRPWGALMDALTIMIMIVPEASDELRGLMKEERTADGLVPVTS